MNANKLLSLQLFSVIGLFFFVILTSAASDDSVRQSVNGEAPRSLAQDAFRGSSGLDASDVFAENISYAQRDWQKLDRVYSPAYTDGWIAEKIIYDAAVGEDRAKNFSAGLGTEAADSTRYGIENQFELFRHRFDEARRPDCLHQDGLKDQPTGIGPLAITGLYALPFILVAKFRGVCS